MSGFKTLSSIWPKQDFNSYPIVIKIINNKNSIVPGIQFRDFIYVEDVVCNFISSREKRPTERYLILAQVKELKQNLIDKINKQVGKGVPIWKIKLRNDENIVSYPSIKK